MFRKFYVFGLLVNLTVSSFTQAYEFPSPSTKALGLSGASDSTAWALFSNPAGIYHFNKVVTGIGYHNAYQLKALSAQSAFCIIPSSLIKLGLAYSKYGENLYNIQNLSATFARALSPDLQFGFRFEYFLRRIQNHSKVGALIVDAGFRYKAYHNVDVAVSVNNPARQGFADEYNEQILPTSIAVACISRLSDEFYLTLDILQRSDYSTMVYAFGLNAQVHRMVEFCGAISAKPLRLAIGTNISWNNIEVKIAGNHHDTLGLSTNVGITYCFGGSKGK